MIKYKTTYGEEFQFDTADEMIRYFDYAKYDKKMNEDFYPDEYHQYTVDNSPEVSDLKQKTLDGNDREILKEAFDKIGIEYEDHGEFLTIFSNYLLSTDRIDVNFNENFNYKFENFEEME